MTDLSAAAPIPTISAFKSPPRSRACFMMLAISGSSSTMRIRVFPGCGVIHPDITNGVFPHYCRAVNSG